MAFSLLATSRTFGMQSSTSKSPPRISAPLLPDQPDGSLGLSLGAQLERPRSKSPPSVRRLMKGMKGPPPAPSRSSPPPTPPPIRPTALQDPVRKLELGAYRKFRAQEHSYRQAASETSTDTSKDDSKGRSAKWEVVAPPSPISRAPPAPPQPQEYRLQVELNRLNEELGTCRRQLETANNQATYLQDTVNTLNRRLQDLYLQNEQLATLNDSESKRMGVLKAFADDEVVLLLERLDSLRSAVKVVSDFLVKNIVFRSSEAFADELEDALEVVLPWLGADFLNILSDRAEKVVSGTGSPGSKWLIRLATEALIYRLLYSQSFPDITKSRIVRTFINLFKIASWALPGVKTRAGFEATIDPLIAHYEPFRNSYTTTSKSTVLLFPSPGSAFAYDTMESVTIHGQPSTKMVGSSEQVIAALEYGVRRGNKYGLRSAVLLKSTLEAAISNEEAVRNVSKEPDRPQSGVIPDCDGLA